MDTPIVSSLEENKFNLSGVDIDAMVAALATLPPSTAKPVTLEFRETCACGKKVPVDKLEMLNTGVFIMPNDVCKGCKAGHKEDAEKARLVCVCCKRVIMRIPPCTDKSGFTFLPGRTYFLEHCGNCNKTTERHRIIEKVAWNNDHKKR